MFNKGNIRTINGTAICSCTAEDKRRPQMSILRPARDQLPKRYSGELTAWGWSKIRDSTVSPYISDTSKIIYLNLLLAN